jgi:hypothetical protein
MGDGSCLDDDTDSELKVDGEAGVQHFWRGLFLSSLAWYIVDFQWTSTTGNRNKAASQFPTSRPPRRWPTEIDLET